MNKFLVPVTLAAALSLTACAGHRDRTAAAYAPIETGTMVAPTLRTGKGRVAYVIDPTGPVDGVSWQRLTLNMEDKSQQVVDRRGQQIAIGEHVEIRSDNTIRRQAQTSKASP